MMSCGPVTAWALEIPATCRSLVATSLALPGEVSTRMNALTDICSSSLNNLPGEFGWRILPGEPFHRSRCAQAG
jgi:hypothetical protein